MSSYNALVSVWEVSDNVAQLLSKARQALKWCEHSSLVPNPSPARGPSPSTNRHRAPCHAILEDGTNRGPAHGHARGHQRVWTPRRCHVDGGGTVIRVVAGDDNGRLVKISTTSSEAGMMGAQGPPKRQVHVPNPASPSWHGGRACAAAEHATKLHNQIRRLQSRHRAICMRLDASDPPRPRPRPTTPSSPTTTFMFI